MGLSGNLVPESSSDVEEGSLMHSYLQSVSKGELQRDPDQEFVISKLQTITNYLVNQTPKKRISKLSTFFSSSSNKTVENDRHGLYLWGGVGRGKTHLVDNFFKQLPIDKKMRLHFHRFMQIVHEEMNSMSDVEDPLKIVAKSFSKKAKMLCLDELHVIDITDAMILDRLLQYLFDYGLVLVTTSNFHPDELYKDGLQRSRFLPAIELLKKHTNVIEMEGDYDYRSEAFKDIGIYYFISDEKSEELLDHHFVQLSGVQLYKGRRDVIINGRLIPVKKLNVDVVWFDFDELCNTPRSTEDYSQIAQFFKSVLISNIPQMTAHMDDAARRFINMIDTFYDKRVNIVVSAAKEPEFLYAGEKLKFEFKRAVSRINEMQTRRYINSNKLNQEQATTVEDSNH